MANGELGLVVRHIHQLAGNHGLDDLSDGQLLERFAGRRDEAAFAALVRRHGPLVLGVCRRVLHETADAEDAFQAVFLVLLRRARALNRERSLANYLYTVAYHTALRAKANAARRLRQERQVHDMPRAAPPAEDVWLDLRPVLDDELNRLPDKYRAPVVLCYLEGKTNEEAARLLGCPVGTVKGRLARARTLLRTRLSRRGVTLPAGLLGATLAERAMAAVPAALGEAAFQTAMLAAAGNATAPAVVLADGVLKALLVARFKAATAVLLAAGTLLLGALTRPVQAQRPAEPAAAPVQQANADPPAPADNPRKTTLTGRVHTPDGKPLAGATVVAEAYFPSRLPRGGPQMLEPVRTDRAGGYRLTVPLPPADGRYLLFLKATADGYGLGSQFHDSTAARPQTDIRMVPECPTRVRLVSLEGAAAARVPVTFSLPNYGVVPTGPSWQGRATTDDQGRLTVRGVGPGWRVWLEVRDERFACQRLELETGVGKETGEHLFTLAPPRPIEGRVLGQDTRKPLGNVRVVIQASHEHTITGEVEGRTDADGRYRIIPFTGSYFDVRAFPADGVPYLPWEEQFAWPKGALRRTQDFTLSRGVLVRGRVNESGSGKPLAGAEVTYRPRRRANPFYRRGLLEDVLAANPTRTGSDGTYQLAVLPGPGHLLVRGPTPDYLHVETSYRALETGKPGGERLYPDGLLALDLKPDAEPPEASFRLRRGVTVKGRVLRPDGQPAHNAAVLCRWYHPFSMPFSHNVLPVADGAYEVPGCDPDRAQPACFLDVEQQLGAVVELPGKQAGEPVTVRLAPCGAATVRFVDGDGKPLANQPVGEGLLFVHLHLVLTPGATVWAMADTEALQSDTAMMVNFDPQRYRALRTDAQGRVTFPTLIPGGTYHLMTGENLGTAKKEFTVKAGQTVDLGDVAMKMQAN
jgi:RNA polymerase sigma factor (sigma-70 family)